MTTLQTIIVSVWVGIILFVIYGVGAVWGGWRAGLACIAAVLLKLAFWAGCISLVYYTCLAIAGR